MHCQSCGNSGLMIVKDHRGNESAIVCTGCTGFSSRPQNRENIFGVSIEKKNPRWYNGASPRYARA